MLSKLQHGHTRSAPRVASTVLQVGACSSSRVQEGAAASDTVLPPNQILFRFLPPPLASPSSFLLTLGSVVPCGFQDAPLERSVPFFRRLKRVPFFRASLHPCVPYPVLNWRSFQRQEPLREETR